MKSTRVIQTATYALYLGLFLCLFAPSNVTASSLSDEVLTNTNELRQASGSENLSRNRLLDTAASAKLNDMKKYEYFDHVSPDNRHIWDFVSEAGYNYSFAGENLARGFKDAREIVGAWNKSPSHRQNMLDKKFSDAGIASDGNYTVLVLASAVAGNELVTSFGGAGVQGKSDFLAVKSNKMNGISPFIISALMVVFLLLIDAVLLAKIHNEDVSYPHLHHHHFD